MKLWTKPIETPFGTMLVAINEANALVRLVFPNEHERWSDEIVRKEYDIVSDSDRCDKVIRQLNEYFQGKRQTFDLPLKPEGTAFQLKVWTALQTIPYGATISYKELAERIGSPAAVRAVGRANGTNPIPVVIPCHRVIGADGSLTGFGGGLALKESLLKLEGAPVSQAVHQISLL